MTFALVSRVRSLPCPLFSGTTASARCKPIIRFLRRSFFFKSEESHPLGTFQWVVAETGRSNSVLMPGETVALVAVDSLGYYSQDNVTEARYLGVVDPQGYSVEEIGPSSLLDQLN